MHRDLMARISEKRVSKFSANSEITVKNFDLMDMIIREKGSIQNDLSKVDETIERTKTNKINSRYNLKFKGSRSDPWNGIASKFVNYNKFSMNIKYNNQSMISQSQIFTEKDQIFDEYFELDKYNQRKESCSIVSPKKKSNKFQHVDQDSESENQEDTKKNFSNFAKLLTVPKT